jgi:hypothetical protein
METALATIIVGVGVMGVMQLLAKGTQANSSSADQTIGVNLVRNLREFSLKLGYNDPNTPTNWGLDAGETVNNPAGWNDLNDMDGQTFSPPIDSRAQQLSNLPNWSQSVVVHSVDPDSLGTDSPNGTTPACRVTVTVTRGTTVVATQTWYVFDGTPSP